MTTPPLSPQDRAHGLDCLREANAKAKAVIDARDSRGLHPRAAAIRAQGQAVRRAACARLHPGFGAMDEAQKEALEREIMRTIDALTSVGFSVAYPTA